MHSGLDLAAAGIIYVAVRHAAGDEDVRGIHNAKIQVFPDGGVVVHMEPR